LKSGGAYWVIYMDGAVALNGTLELSEKEKHGPLHAGIRSSEKLDICIVRSPDDDSVEEGEQVSVGVAIGL
jgi:hypothetical protein